MTLNVHIPKSTGMVRKTVLELTRGRWPLLNPEGAINTIDNIVEKKLTMTEVKKASAEGRLLEVFGTGTAVGVIPVAKLKIDGVEYLMESGDEIGPICEHILNELYAIFYGHISDHPLAYIVE